MSLILARWMRCELEEAAVELEEWHGKEPEDRAVAFYLRRLFTRIGNHKAAFRMDFYLTLSALRPSSLYFSISSVRC
jgi:hypothetical protein